MKKLLLPVVCSLLAGSLTANAGQIIPTLTLTEVSNTQLDWTWFDPFLPLQSGSLITATANDWGGQTINLATSPMGPFAVASDSFYGSWAEPEGPVGRNNSFSLDFSGFDIGIRTGLSDTLTEYGTPTTNGAFLSYPAPYPNGVRVAYIDRAAEAVPEATSSLLLLAMSGAILFSLRRRTFSAGG